MQTFKRLITPYNVILGVIFIAFIILRFMEPETRAVFGWDQVVNSWVVKDMILAGKRPLVGMVAKGNTGFYIGPAYYYLLVPFYWIFNLDPIANSVFAGVVSTVTAVVFLLIVRKLFDRATSLVAFFVYTFSGSAIIFDRIAWPVVFLPLTSILIFYLLYRVLTCGKNFIYALAAVIGFSFHTHFTAVYYVIIVFFCAPVIFRQRDGLLTSVKALPLFLVWFVPNLISEIGKGYIASRNMAYYLKTFFHGLHLTRVLQLVNDAFIEFESILRFHYLKHLNIILPAIYVYAVWKSQRPDRKVLLFLTVLWFGVPWLVMSMYAGEITNYYFSITRPLVYIVIGYVVSRVFFIPNKIPAVLIAGYLVYWSFINVSSFWYSNKSDLPENREAAKKAIREDKRIEFVEWEAKSYLYEVYKNVYHYTNEPENK